MGAAEHIQEAAAAPREAKVRLFIAWLLLLFGLAIGVVAGSFLPRAITTRDAMGLVVSGLMVFCGLLALVAGVGRVRRALLGRAGIDGAITAGDEALPRLGEILVYKYHLISEKDVERALARQREAAPRPLGEILVDMGKITWRDLAKALEDQLAYGDPWRRG